MPMILAGKLGRGAIRARARELLAQVGVGHRAGSLPNMLSGGEQQRVTIARAMANNPSLLLLDEPTGDLDTRNTDIVITLLKKLNEEDGISIVMVTHDVALKNFGNRVIMMRDGKIASIRRVPKDKREESHRLLAGALEEFDALATEEATHEDGHFHDISIALQKSELRKPWHYKPLSHRKEEYEAARRALQTDAIELKASSNLEEKSRASSSSDSDPVVNSIN